MTAERRPHEPALRVIEGGLEAAARPQVTVVVPAHNEQESLTLLAHRVRDVLDRAGRSFELIIVDDGSTDASEAALVALHDEDPRFRARLLQGQQGKSAALDCGVHAARGDILLWMDADLQDLPEEMELLLGPVERGELDLVQGHRAARNDTRFKVVASWIFNRLVSWAGGLDVRDVNCGFKAMRLAVARAIPLGDDMHRFVPVFAHQAGYRVGEVTVRHAARAFGASRYGWGRYLRGFVDIGIVLILPRLVRWLAPGLGAIGALSLLASAASAAALVVLMVRGPEGLLLEVGLTGLWFLSCAVAAFTLSWAQRLGVVTPVAGPRNHRVRKAL